MPKRRRRTIRSRQSFIPRPYIASLDFQWMHLMASGLSKAFHLSYSSGQRCFIDFCLQFGLLIPVIAFCRHRLFQFRVSLVIYRFFINHLRSNHIFQRLDPLHVIMGLDSPSVNHPRIQLVLRGYKAFAW